MDFICCIYDQGSSQIRRVESLEMCADCLLALSLNVSFLSYVCKREKQ